MVTGVVIGSALVRWAVRSPRISIKRDEPVHGDESYDLDDIRVAPADEQSDSESGLHPTTLAFALIGVTILLSVGILWSARDRVRVGIRHSRQDATVPGGGYRGIHRPVGRDKNRALTSCRQACGGGHLLDRPRRPSGVCHRTMSLATIGSNIPAIVVFTVIGVGWSVVSLIVLGRRFHRYDWFEHAIADFGQSQGNVATGFVLADMVDPRRRTTTANAYGYKQLPYEPFLGGGLLTALSVPIIVGIGLPWFTAVSALAVVVIGVWGIRRNPSR
jgi:ESS family glutamate:Na+ symporter